jgi:Cu2+-exporting ATPase
MAKRSRAQALADRAAFFLTIVAVAAARATLVGWLVAGRDASFVVQRVVTVLVIAFPHALGAPFVHSVHDNKVLRFRKYSHSGTRKPERRSSTPVRRLPR